MSDQGFSLISEGCFKCLPSFINGKPVRQRLERYVAGGIEYWRCPKCGGYYGRTSPGDDKPQPVQRGHEVEQAERDAFARWFVEAYNYPAFAYNSPNDERAAFAWSAWRARAAKI